MLMTHHHTKVLVAHGGEWGVGEVVVREENELSTAMSNKYAASGKGTLKRQPKR